ncbi:hypothetical protein [Lactobacillus delbrueckii]|uniref:hypothetical protein n=1 Tax=Lactobacillus delbrueckii TaxID=1584 RepID=UPI00067F9FE6|nr:hypothetical protein [Lactobacillus delbrueckii]KNE31143.1 hypothetical protein LDI10_01900 [Lactobacillus delbrueckii subsp. indicus]
MSKYIKVGSGGGEVTWHRAILDMEPGDYLLLEPGYYVWPRGRLLEDVTIKGLGASPEDTRIRSFFSIGENSSRVVFENLTLEPYGDVNTLDLPEETNSYLILRSCVLTGTLSFFEKANFRLEMADCLLDYESEKFGTISLEGTGTAIINNSEIRGTVNSFDSSNIELNINNSAIGNLNLGGKSWVNVYACRFLNRDYSLYARGECWLNILESQMPSQLAIEDHCHLLMQNSQLYNFQARGESQSFLSNVQIAAAASLEGKSFMDGSLVTFSGNGDYPYFIFLVDQAVLKGRNLQFDPQNWPVLVDNDARLVANALYYQGAPLEIKCEHPENISLMGIKWTERNE